jgi:hypothetical protein
MRIAGINSPNYQNKKPDSQSADSGVPNTPRAADSSGNNQEILAVHANHGGNPKANHQPSANGDQGQDFSVTQYLPSITQAQHHCAQHNGELMQASAKESSNISSVDRVAFFTQPGRVWNAYSTSGPSAAGQAGTAVPDNTSHKARAAIAEYMQTQFIEERLHFAQYLGIDDYA